MTRKEALLENLKCWADITAPNIVWYVKYGYVGWKHLPSGTKEFDTFEEMIDWMSETDADSCVCGYEVTTADEWVAWDCM